MLQCTKVTEEVCEVSKDKETKTKVLIVTEKEERLLDYIRRNDNLVVTEINKYLFQYH